MTAAGLKDLYERWRRALLRRPSLGRSNAQAHVRWDDPRQGEIQEGAWRMRVGQSLAEGGLASAPHPDQMMRAGVIASLAIGYRLWGARLDVAIDAVEVDLTCDWDERGPLGIGGVAVGWQRMVIDVRIVSPAPEPDVRRVVETADRLSPLLANLSPAIERVHHLRVVHPRNA